MKTTEKRKVYLTFPTEPEISLLLKKVANDMGKTQPELIEEICKDFLKELLLNQIDSEIG